MELKPIASNMTEVSTKTATILFSYSTPVACYLDNGSGYLNGYFRTDKKWSATTTRHINKWLGSIKAIEQPQEFFDNLV